MGRNAFITRVNKIIKDGSTQTLTTSPIRSDVYTEIYLVRLSITGGAVGSYVAGIVTNAGEYPLISGTNFSGRVNFPFYCPVMLPYGSRAYVTVVSPAANTTIDLVMFGVMYPKSE